MKKKLQKLLWIIIVTLTITNMLCATVSQATQQGTSQTVINTVGTPEEDNILSGIFGGIGWLIDGIVGIISKIIQIPLLLIGMGIQGILTGIATIEGSTIQGFITPDDIFFNRVGLTNINFFDLGRPNSVVYVIRTNIATWYYILQILAIIILLVVLIYVGIRMAISTVASDQAKYKKMLTDWAMSFALLFFLGYIIMFTLEANNALVDMLGQASRVTIGNGVVTQLALDIVTGGATKSWAAFIVYFALIGMTTAFLLAYLKRMLTIGFLIIISPLITITYSIDKMKDGQAQALNTWLREFMFGVLIQPFHIIIYLVFVSTTLDLLSTGPSLAKMFLAIITMGFIWTAEKIVKEIFGLKNATSMGETLAAMGIVREIGNAASKAAKTAASAGGKVASRTKFGQNIQQKIGNTKLGQTYQRIANNPNNSKMLDMGKKIIKTTGAVGVGAASFGFEMGANTPAHAAQAGVEGYKVGKALFNPDPNVDGSPQQIQLKEQDLKRFADLIAQNNNFSFADYNNGNTANKNNLKAYVQSLIGANMNHLNNDIQRALANLTRANPTDYNTTTAAGNQHLLDLQNAALDPNLDFTDPSTNPLGRAWTQEEQDVITAIQVKNLAGAVNDAHKQYQSAGRQNPSQDVDSFIDSL